MKKHLLRFFDAIEDTPITPASFVAAFTAIVVFRITIEQTLVSFRNHSPESYFLTFTHYFLEFLLTLLLTIPIVRWANGGDFKRAANLIIFSFLLVLTPPLTDLLIMGNPAPFSIYEFGSFKETVHHFFTFFDDTPEIGITYGIRLEIALSVLGIALYAYLRSKKFWKAAVSGILVYAVLYLVSTFPSWITFVLLTPEKGLFAITGYDTVGLFLSPQTILSNPAPDMVNALHAKMSLVYGVLLVPLVGALILRYFRKYFLALWNNARFPQIIWHGGLLFLGGTLAMIFAGVRPGFDIFTVLAVASLVAAVESAWIASVVANDITDKKIDEVTNPARPLPTHTIPEHLYAEMGMLFFLASLLLAAIVNIKLALVLLAYQAIAWIYSMPPLRLKRFPVIATLLSSSAGILVLLAGFLALSPAADLATIPPSLLSFLFVAYVLTIPLKDFKDVRGDGADGVFTIPVLLGIPRARLAIGSALFLCYAASPVVFHEPRFIVPGVLFGSLAYFSIARAERGNRSRITFRSLAAWNMLIAALYGLIAAAIVML
jgi:4-hydroxybenzoate polyprenyltransferase